MDPIEAEARAYVNMWRDDNGMSSSFHFLVAMIVALDARDAEISRLTEIARRDHGHNEPCLMCGKPCNSLAGNPSLWALRLGNDGWRHAGCVNDALRELTRLRAGPGAAAMEPLGKEFEKVLHDNLLNLYVRSAKPESADVVKVRAKEASRALDVLAHKVRALETEVGRLKRRIAAAGKKAEFIRAIATKPGSDT